MTICAISDTHGNKKIILPPADVLVHCGDFTRSRVHYKDEALEFLDWFATQPHEHKIVVAGNHDFYPYYNSDDFTAACKERDITYLQDSSITISNVKFYGTPWTPPFYDWAFMQTERELVQTYSSIPQDTNVLITHGPAYTILDQVPSGENAGSSALLCVLPQLSLKAHLFGHIHHQGGKSSGIHHNCSVLNEAYKLANPATVVSI